MTYAEYIKKTYDLNPKINDYLHVKDNHLFYENIDLFELAQKFGTPLEVAYTDLINKRIKELTAQFNKALKKYNYEGEFIYTFASKANTHSEVVTTALNEVSGLEATSGYDLEIINYLLDRKLFPRQDLIICNGFKHGSYFSAIRILKNKGLNVIPVLENEDELKMFLQDSSTTYDVGLRLNVDNRFLEKYGLGVYGSIDSKGRFGIFEDELFKFAERIQASPNLNLKLLHVHVGGTITDTNYYTNIVATVYEHIYCKLPPTVTHFDVGGGLPVQYSLDFKFDYADFAEQLVSKIASISKVKNSVQPNIIGEYGRYTVNDHSFVLFNVDLVKQSYINGTDWYLVNGSLMTTLPDMWALHQRFMILPLNGWDRSIKSVFLGGLTCDPDDVYLGDADNTGGMFLPSLDSTEPLYLGVFGTGAYQEMISGVKGVHHCLLPEAQELIIYKKNGEHKFDKINPHQSSDTVLHKLEYHNEHELERYLT